MDSKAKIRVKVGPMEIEYEGDPSFLDGGIETLLKTMGELSSPEDFSDIDATDPLSPVVNSPSKNTPQLSTAGIAGVLGAKSCGDLAICALGKLQVVDGVDSATRKEIHEEMKTATAYFKQSMRGGNLSQAFDSLCKAGRINPLSGDKFSLRAKERETLEAKIAET